MRRRTLALVGALGVAAIVILVVALSGARDVPAAPAPSHDPSVARSEIDAGVSVASDVGPREVIAEPSRDETRAAPPTPSVRPEPPADAGPTRLVRGFVVDLARDPVVGIPVALVPMAPDRRAARASTDRSGGFRFDAPLGGLRVEADGGDLGQDRAWVGAGEGEQVLELVLEPVGVLTVLVGRGSARTTIAVRTRDPRALGPDRSWELMPEAVGDDELDVDEVAAAEAEVIARRTEVASGRVGEPLTLPANVWYDVVAAGADDPDRSCGRVVLAPGEERTMFCEATPAPSSVVGRIVTIDGAPAASVALTAFAGGAHDAQTVELMAGPDGRFRATFQLADPALVELAVRGEVLVRRNVVLSPGDERDIGDVTLLTGEAVPDPWPDGAYGGIGGLVAFGDDGVTILDMETDSPLYLDGVERDDTIVLVDGMPLSELPDDEALVRLRGAPGTHVELRLRSARGELYDLVLERKLMAAPSETWVPGGGRVPDDVGD